MRGFRKVLIAVNGSKEVLKQGLKLACDEKCWITVVKVLPANEGDLNLTGVKNIEDVLSSCGRSEISAMKKIADDEGLLIKTRLEEGDAFRQIVQAAEEEHCDVIVMGAKKKSWPRMIFGDNTVEKVIRQAPCPVLVVSV